MTEFTFEESAWEAAAKVLRPGQTLPAARFLALLEAQSDETVEQALQLLEDKRILLDVQSLPGPAGSGELALRLRQEEQLAQSQDLIHGLEENDPLRLYLQELAQLPAAGDVQVLAEQYAGGDETVGPVLTNCMLGLVVEQAKTFTGRGVLLLDLIQEGSMGLLQAIGSYETGDFEAHCRWWIAHYLSRAVTLQARDAGVGQKLSQGMEDYRRADGVLLTKLGRNPMPEEIAEYLHMTQEEADVYRQMLETVRVRAQADALRTPEQSTPDDQQAVENTAYFQMRQRIAELLSGLSEEETRLLTLRFGLEGGKPLSPEETGKQLGLTPAEVTEKEAAALARVRQQSE